MKISENLKAFMQTDLDRAKMADAIGVAVSTLVRWTYYDNEKFERLSVIAAIEKVTGLTQEEIFEKEEIANQ